MSEKEETKPTSDKSIQVEDPAGQRVNSGVINSKTKFFRGRFATKANVNDPTTVRLSVNGEVLVFQRDVETIVPEPYAVVAENCRYPQFSVKPGEGRKVVAYISRFPFTKTGDATYQEFKELFIDGTRKTQDNIRRYGLNVPVADAVPQLS